MFIERRGGTDAEREVEITQGAVDRSEGGGVFMLWTERVSINANGVRGYYL